MFSKYNYVYEVYKERNFTKAAEKLFISQPSLSVAIKNIEKKLGAELFERLGSSVELTEVGKEYIATAERIKACEKEFFNRMNDINNLQTGKLVVGGTNYLSSYVLPKIINRFNKLHPNIEIELVEANSLNLSDMVEKDQVDIIVDSFDDLNGYNGFFLASEDILLCVPKDREINNKLEKYQITPKQIHDAALDIENIDAVSLELFKNENFVLLKKGNDMYNRAMRFLKEKNMDVKITYRVDQLNISYALVESGIGLCFITDTFVKYGGYSDNVVLYKLSNGYYSRNLYIAYKKNKYCTKAMAEFIKIAKDMLRETKIH